MPASFPSPCCVSENLSLIYAVMLCFICQSEDPILKCGNGDCENLLCDSCLGEEAKRLYTCRHFDCFLCGSNITPGAMESAKRKCSAATSVALISLEKIVAQKAAAAAGISLVFCELCSYQFEKEPMQMAKCTGCKKEICGACGVSSRNHREQSSKPKRRKRSEEIHGVKPVQKQQKIVCCEDAERNVLVKKEARRVVAEARDSLKDVPGSPAAMSTKCPTCESKAEKNGGCNGMTCPCGATFCFRCGQKTNSQHDETHFGVFCKLFDSEEKGDDDQAQQMAVEAQQLWDQEELRVQQQRGAADEEDFGGDILRGQQQRGAAEQDDFGGDMLRGQQQRGAAEQDEFGGDMLRGQQPRRVAAEADFGGDALHGLQQRGAVAEADFGGDALRLQQQRGAVEQDDLGGDMLRGQQQRQQQRRVAAEADFGGDALHGLQQRGAAAEDDDDDVVFLGMRPPAFPVAEVVLQALVAQYPHLGREELEGIIAAFGGNAARVLQEAAFAEQLLSTFV